MILSLAFFFREFWKWWWRVTSRGVDASRPLPPTGGGWQPCTSAATPPPPPATTSMYSAVLKKLSSSSSLPTSASSSSHYCSDFPVFNVLHILTDLQTQYVIVHVISSLLTQRRTRKCESVILHKVCLCKVQVCKSREPGCTQSSACNCFPGALTTSYSAKI